MSVGVFASIFGGVGALMGRLTSTRAGYLDNLNGLVASRLDTTITSRASSSALATVDTNVDTLVARLTSGRASNLDNLNATISSRLSSAVRQQVTGYTSGTASTGTGFYTRYRDVTESFTSYTKVMLQSAGNLNSSGASWAITGGTVGYSVIAYPASNTIVRCCTPYVVTPAYLTCHYQGVEFY